MPRKGKGSKTWCDRCALRWACRTWANNWTLATRLYYTPICLQCDAEFRRRHGDFGDGLMMPVGKDLLITEEMKQRARGNSPGNDGEPEEGAIVLNGEPLRAVPPMRRRPADFRLNIRNRLRHVRGEGR